MKAAPRWSRRALLKVEGHGISQEEVECALRGPSFTRRSGARLTLIAACGGRTLFIVLEDSELAPGVPALVTARLATTSEEALLARRGEGLR